MDGGTITAPNLAIWSLDGGADGLDLLRRRLVAQQQRHLLVVEVELERLLGGELGVALEQEREGLDDLAARLAPARVGGAPEHGGRLVLGRAPALGAAEARHPLREAEGHEAGAGVVVLARRHSAELRQLRRVG